MVHRSWFMDVVAFFVLLNNEQKFILLALYLVTFFEGCGDKDIICIFDCVLHLMNGIATLNLLDYDL